MVPRPDRLGSPLLRTFPYYTISLALFQDRFPGKPGKIPPETTTGKPTGNNDRKSGKKTDWKTGRKRRPENRTGNNGRKPDRKR